MLSLMHIKRFSNVRVFLWRVRKIVRYFTVLTYRGKIHENLWILMREANKFRVSGPGTLLHRLNNQIFCSFSAIMTPESVVPSINF
jgi:hypothetical protein